MRILEKGVWAVVMTAGIAAYSSESAGSASPKGPPPIVLSPFGVSEKPVNSFGFSITGQRDGITHKIVTLSIDRVSPDSEAEMKGLKPMTRILKIDGRDVREFTGSVLKGSDLNKKLINRKPGDSIILEVLEAGKAVPKTLTLTEQVAVLDPSFGPNMRGTRHSVPGVIFTQ